MFDFIKGLFGQDRTFGAIRSKNWPKVRKEYLEAHPLCEVCGSSKKCQVHHKEPVHLFPELELESSNFITLCDSSKKNCHFQFGHLYSFHSYNPNVVEDAKIWHDKLKNKP